MLTIGQLARSAGCTVKAVRVYHERGLLAEPGRDAAGYRRYGAQAVIDLTRIVTLARSGVPLADIPALLTAHGPDRDAELRRIDAALDDRIRELTVRRHRLAMVDAPERLCLTPAMLAQIDRERSLGFSERFLQIVRDSWILTCALAPAEVARLVAERERMLDDAEYVAIQLTYDEAYDWSADDPRIETLARRTAAAMRLFWAAGAVATDLEAGTADLLNDYQSGSAAWTALRHRVEELLGDTGGRPPEAAGAMG